MSGAIDIVIVPPLAQQLAYLSSVADTPDLYAWLWVQTVQGLGIHPSLISEDDKATTWLGWPFDDMHAARAEAAGALTEHMDGTGHRAAVVRHLQTIQKETAIG